MRKSLAILLLAVSGIAFAAPHEIQKSPGSSADDLLRLSQETLRQIDENRGSDLWKTSAPFIRTKFSEADYAGRIIEARKRLGVLRERNWISIARVRQSDDTLGVPAGFYANVDFAAQTGNGTVLLERLSFKLEPDGWHPVGYVAQDKP